MLPQCGCGTPSALTHDCSSWPFAVPAGLRSWLLRLAALLLLPAAYTALYSVDLQCRRPSTEAEVRRTRYPLPRQQSSGLRQSACCCGTMAVHVPFSHEPVKFDVENVTKALVSGNKLASELLRKATSLQSKLQMIEQVCAHKMCM